jgi:segregation and condensation protein A
VPGASLAVDTPEFSGPLDLLASLIQKRRLDVTTLSLALVADQYLAQVMALEGELEALSEFVAIASQLLLIKSRALLPALEPVGVEEDPAEDLQRRLLDYQRLRAAAVALSERESEGARMWPRGGELELPRRDLPLAPLVPSRLAALAASQLRRPVPAPAAEAAPRLSLRARALTLFRGLRPGVWTALGRLLGGDVSTAVATFLAALVLVRRGLLQLRQDEAYSPVQVRLSAGDLRRIAELDDWS